MHCLTTPEFPDAQVIYALAQLLVGIDTAVFNDGVSAPWKGIGTRVGVLPLQDREAALQREVSALPGISWDELAAKILAVDPTTECQDDQDSDLSDIAKLPPAAPFPVEALPPAFHDLVTEGAQAIGCPPEYIAVPLLYKSSRNGMSGHSCTLPSSAPQVLRRRRQNASRPNSRWTKASNTAPTIKRPSNTLMN